MHLPDGLLNAPVSIAGAVLAAGLVAISLRKSALTVDDRQVPMAGLLAAFVFAVQMLNFPIATGTSGHLLGGCLAAILVGPWLGSLALTVVVLVQALVFADGGLTALGVNIVLMAFTGCWGGYGVFLVLRRVLRLGGTRSRTGVPVIVGIAAWCAVQLAVTVFVLAYSAGGGGVIGTSTVAWAMFGFHAVVGAGEAVITALAVAAVLAARPDLVYAARDSEAGRALDPAGVMN
jgi:cobalt/nickel transport system permease protein